MMNTTYVYPYAGSLQALQQSISCSCSISKVTWHVCSLWSVSPGMIIHSQNVLMWYDVDKCMKYVCKFGSTTSDFSLKQNLLVLCQIITIIDFVGPPSYSKVLALCLSSCFPMFKLMHILSSFLTDWNLITTPELLLNYTVAYWMHIAQHRPAMPERDVSSLSVMHTWP